MQLDLLQEVVPPNVRKASAAVSRKPRPTPNLSVKSKKERVMSDDTQAAIIDAADDPEKAPGAFKTISEVAEFLDVPQHVLRFWESRFAQIKPLKLRGGRRYYRPQDIETLQTIKTLLYKQGYTIKGARKIFGKKLPVLESAKPEQPAMRTKPALSEKQQSQLSVIRQELLGMKDALEPYL